MKSIWKYAKLWQRCRTKRVLLSEAIIIERPCSRPLYFFISFSEQSTPLPYSENPCLYTYFSSKPWRNERKALPSQSETLRVFVIVKTCSDNSFTIGQKKCQMFYLRTEEGCRDSHPYHLKWNASTTSMSFCWWYITISDTDLPLSSFFNKRLPQRDCWYWQYLFSETR